MFMAEGGEAIGLVKGGGGWIYNKQVILLYLEGTKSLYLVK